MVASEEEWPATLSINAWIGEAPAQGEVSADLQRWAVWSEPRIDDGLRVGQPLAADEPPDLRLWTEPNVGWGLVLPDNENLPEGQRSSAADAPEPIQELVARRKGPVFRYRPDLNNRFLRRYYSDGSHQDTALTSGGQRGTTKGALPYYLLLFGSPTVIPWTFQYVLQGPCFVGRLDLDGLELERYVAALLSGWSDALIASDRPLMWAVDEAESDITHLMRISIAEPVFKRWSEDPQIRNKAVALRSGEASGTDLEKYLVEQAPAMVLTTSHGMTGPIGDSDQMARNLGLLVDQSHALITPDSLVRNWQPDGAIWYAHACCSAGSDAMTSFEGLVEPTSDVGRILEAVASLGAQVAPFPQVLLGCERPLRAFIGHIEPTFNWTLRQKETGQRITSAIEDALYCGMYRANPEPVGMAFRRCYLQVGEWFAQWAALMNKVAIDPHGRARSDALTTKLMALDRQSMVILGDPTVALPPLPATR